MPQSILSLFMHDHYVHGMHEEVANDIHWCPVQHAFLLQGRFILNNVCTGSFWNIHISTLDLSTNVHEDTVYWNPCHREIILNLTPIFQNEYISKLESAHSLTLCSDLKLDTLDYDKLNNIPNDVSNNKLMYF